MSAGACGLEALGEGRFRSSGPDATRALGFALGELLEPGDVVVLTGDLGAGKTCLTAGVAHALGDPVAVTSPTYTIMCVHDGGRMPLYHFDLYRLEDAAQLDDVGLFDVLGGDGACLVEWGDLFIGELGEERLDLTLLRDACDGDSEPSRTIVATPYGRRARELAARLEEALRR